MIPIPKRIHWEAHSGELYVRCDEGGETWEERATHVKHIEVMGLPGHLTELSYWWPSRGFYRVMADRPVDLDQQQCELVLSWLLAMRRAARNLLGIED